MGGGKRRVESARAGGDLNDKRIINQIMLKFRPIAPKPVTVESSAGLVPVKEKRAKRKYVRVKNKMTVAMMKVSNAGEFVMSDPVVRNVPEWISFDVSRNNRYNRENRDNFIGDLEAPAPVTVGLHDVDLTLPVKRAEVVESWITMESVTGTCEDVRRLRYSTDEEIWKDLEIDSCPGFVSNGYDEVQWVNLAYRRMVDPNPDGGAPPPEVVVSLGVKSEKSTVTEYWPAFSCRVRVVYQLSEKKKQITVPCDVWKMDSGGYAWRLDVTAALSLGRLN